MPDPTEKAISRSAFREPATRPRFDGPGRRSIRLPEFDYSRGGPYFITICTRHRARILSRISGGRLAVTSLGLIVRDCWQALPNHFPHLRLDSIVIMPDHVHAILWIVRGKTSIGEKPAPITQVVGVWKSFAARRINAIRGTHGHPVWQRNYYEHIVRDHDSLTRIRAYIRNNPAHWRR